MSEKIYRESPIWAQQCAVAAYGWWWHRRRFSKHYTRLVLELRERENWTTEQFLAYQRSQLNKVLAAAWRSPYYRGIVPRFGVIQGVDPFDVLRRMPLLTKEALRTKARELVTQSPLPKGTIVFKSSGTTGTPTEIFYTPEFHALELAVIEARNLNWAGVSYGQRRVMFGVRKVCRFDQNKPPFWRFSPAENLSYASIYHLSPQYLPYYLEFLRSFRPAIVMGYPSAINAIASYSLDKNDRPYPAKAVITTSETVSNSSRQRIEAAFNCRIFDAYCAVEMCLFASQCEYGRYHASPDVGLIEIINSDGKEAVPGEIGQIVCTGLQNTLQPLLRYCIGDVARWAVDQTCQCGRAMPILETIEGRFEDLCYTPDGREMLRFDTVFKGVNAIREAQVVQETLELFRIYVVPTEQFGQHDVELIRHNMQLHAGNVHTIVERVDSIPRSSSGKFKAVICKLSREDKARLAAIKSRGHNVGRFECRI